MLFLALFAIFMWLLYTRRCPVIVARVWFSLCLTLLVVMNFVLCVSLRVAASKKIIKTRSSEKLSCIFTGLLLGKVLWWLSPHIRVRFLEGSLDWRAIECRGAVGAGHTSFFDTLLFLWLCPLGFLANCKAFAKKALWKLPLMGEIIRACGHFPVYFNSQDASSFSVDKEKQALIMEKVEEFMDGGGVICFFPEGVLNSTPSTLKDFRIGTFNMLIKHHMPIHYMVYSGSHEVWNPVMKGLPGFPADVHFFIGKYEYAKDASGAEVAKGLREVMQKHLDRMLAKRKSEQYVAPIRRYLVGQ
ncbi:acyltransferase [Trypanosoma rangeli]|uniref:Acyltransferase n=1 Tax=Trypanosoma rangeli TaxID=5698 RepID=A0A3R7NKA0_TRYRA|nr:acyltransferase [Trypanosoma rangeli]RNF03886.1 acyltransferase [Trypanosoma rangeli]|eukprot:RNF03886.1 acyltransferase [Trypanosoma rangeli]